MLQASCYNYWTEAFRFLFHILCRVDFSYFTVNDTVLHFCVLCSFFFSVTAAPKLWVLLRKFLILTSLLGLWHQHLPKACPQWLENLRNTLYKPERSWRSEAVHTQAPNLLSCHVAKSAPVIFIHSFWRYAHLALKCCLANKKKGSSLNFFYCCCLQNSLTFTLLPFFFFLGADDLTAF